MAQSVIFDQGGLRIEADCTANAFDARSNEENGIIAVGSLNTSPPTAVGDATEGPGGPSTGTGSFYTSETDFDTNESASLSPASDSGFGPNEVVYFAYSSQAGDSITGIALVDFGFQATQGDCVIAGTINIGGEQGDADRR